MGKACSCDAPSAETIYRCRECFKAPLFCAKCIVNNHEANPFHQIEKWDRTHFRRVSLESLGLVVQTCLQSGARRCAEVTDNSVKRHTVTLGHHNGLHTVTIEFCSHTAQRGATVDPEWLQLVAVQLFPASFTTPKTVFTWTVMKEFHIHCLSSKKSAYDYVKALCKLTNNAFISEVQDRYREFMFAYRIWRYLALERRLGQAHGIDEFVPHRQPGSLALRCPSCPEVGFNITLETIKAALESESHKFTLFLSADGNFQLQRKNKRDDPDDVALNAGAGYFVETEEYKRYLKVVKPTEDLGTCSHLRAARMQNIAKFKNAVISGVVAVQCARHGFFLPQGMVDLKKGEAFANTDYAIMHALAEAWKLRWIMITYDIWCQFSIHFKDRITEWFPTMVAIIKMVRGAIPKMHIHNHIERCQIEWNLNWLAYSAFTIGEMIETGWVEHNLTAGSTKEQNDGNRHDSVDDTSGNWNWDKMVGLAATLQRLFRICQKELRKRRASFEALSEMYDEKTIEEWSAMSTESRMEKGKFVSPFQTNFENGERPHCGTDTSLILRGGPPTHAEAYAKLLRAELDAEAATQENRTGDTALISSALLVERDQQIIERMVAQRSDADVLRAARGRLHKNLTDLRIRLVARVPNLEAHIIDPDPEKPEKEPLYIPSYFQEASRREELKLSMLARVEYTLRTGQAFDALADVRTAIRTLNFNLFIKKAAIHGVGPNTKAQNFLKILSNDIQIAAANYRAARKGLLRLGMDLNDKTLRELLREDLFGKSGQRVAMGDSRKQDSWVWTTGRGSDLSEEEEKKWELEGTSSCFFISDSL
ncbi:hypothetical protein C8R43DRAFT_895982 [Mycena crocata]|nr:hypothetical protein C8R43DRAFT_895982 [Mycena crocata]